MSNRTAQASKAIRLAWQNEQELVKNGKGTRDWTPEQQRDILESGKAHDENGKAFEGHHMKNVANYPEHQGNPDNIQFLSSSEHLAAHNGCFQNPTNGRFDPLTGETLDFGQGIRPFEAIALSSPVAEGANQAQDLDSENLAEPMRGICGPNKASSQPTKKRTVNSSESVKRKKTASKHSPGVKKSPLRARLGGIGESIRQFFSNGVELVTDHKDEIKLVAKEYVLPVVAAAGIAYISKSASNGSGTHSHTSAKSSGGTVGSDSLSSLLDSSLINDVAKVGRASPREHSVSGYTRNLNGRQIPVRPYTRGGKN